MKNIIYHKIGNTAAGYVLLEMTPTNFDAFIALLANGHDDDMDTGDDGRFLLDVEWMSQQGNDIRADCGPACMAMAFNWFQVGEFSVKDTAVAMNAVNKTTTTTGFIKLCKKHRMNFRNYGAFDKSSEPLKVPVIRRELALNRLVIALVAYDKINPPAPYDGAHWVLMTGFDNSGVYFHDPYRNVDGGHIHMTDDLFDEALQVPNQQPYNGLALWP